MNKTTRNTIFVKNKAKELGFADIGFSKVEKLKEEEIRLKNWLGKGYHSTMSYMENHFDKRLDPSKLVPSAKSIISLSYNYYTDSKQYDKDTLKVSKYAFGRDYHKVIKTKLKQLIISINEELDVVSGRGFVDSAPVLEQAWAQKSGLGWVGKNTLLINPKKGSYFFLSELILDMEFDYDNPISDHCGNCTKCIDACPTDAISPNGYELNAGKCISFLTIENKEKISEEYRGKMNDYIFGCDICQEVCPWNKYAEPHKEKDFIPKEKFLKMTREDWYNLTQKQYEELFFGTPITRSKYNGIRRNIEFII